MVRRSAQRRRERTICHGYPRCCFLCLALHARCAKFVHCSYASVSGCLVHLPIHPAIECRPATSTRHADYHLLTSRCTTDAKTCHAAVVPNREPDFRSMGYLRMCKRVRLAGDPRSCAPPSARGASHQDSPLRRGEPSRTGPARAGVGSGSDRVESGRPRRRLAVAAGHSASFACVPPTLCVIPAHRWGDSGASLPAASASVRDFTCVFPILRLGP